VVTEGERREGGAWVLRQTFTPTLPLGLYYNLDSQSDSGSDSGSLD